MYAPTRLTDAPTVTPLSHLTAGTQDTSKCVTILSSDHGRKRRVERGIDKRDLKSAIRYGKKERANPCPRTGKPRWKFTFGGAPSGGGRMNGRC